MRGKYQIEVYDKYVAYRFEVRRNITVIQGDSGTGKTQLIRLISDYNRGGTSSGVVLRCEKECIALNVLDWEAYLRTAHEKIIFVDENSAFIRSKTFAEIVNYSDNYYVLIYRDSLPQLSYSIQEIYGMRESRDSQKYVHVGRVYNELYPLYNLKPPIPLVPETVVTEDSNAGNDCFVTIFPNRCCSAKGGGALKKIAILGSTGSIGKQTLDVAREQGDIEVVALCARRSVALMEEQIREFRPKKAVMWDEEAAKDLRVRVGDLDVEVLSGMDGILEVASMDGYEYFVTAIMGMVGIRPTVAAIEAGKKIALANKETLVTAGHLIMKLAAEKGVPILPVDSEHSAIFQSLNGEAGNRIDKIWLTASGGPFRGRTQKELQNVRPEDALKHPTWAMGRKITIDSSTLVNKGLEVIEARWLFDVDPSQIKVLVHPQSIIHSMVEYEDGGIIAQLGVPDMRLPIQYALYYPERRPMKGEKLDFYTLGQITFEKPDMDAFPALRLAYKAIEKGGNLPTVFNAADELVVQMFLDGKISFLDIAALIQKCMESCRFREDPTLDEIFDTEREVQELIKSWKC